MPQDWIKFSDQEPEYGENIIYWFKPFEKAYIGKYYDGSIIGQIGFCDKYDAPYWMPVVAKVTLEDHEKSHWLSVLSEQMNQDCDRDLKEVMVRFIKGQKRLDPEVEKILYDNLTELYD
jgi:hypothetical protein